MTEKIETTPREPGSPIEVPLPSGTFARVRPPRFFDKLMANADCKDETKLKLVEAEMGERVDLFLPSLMARCVLFDDAKVTFMDILKLDSRDTDKLCEVMLPFMTGPVK